MTKISHDQSTDTSEPSTNGKVESKKFNIGKMREAARQYSATGGFGGKEELITVPVYCPPPADEFIRVRDDDDYWIECMTLDYTSEKGGKNTYFIHEDLLPVLPDQIKNLTKWSRLYTAMIRRGTVTFLWRVKVYSSGPGELSTATALNWRKKPSRCGCGSGGRTEKATRRTNLPAITATRNGLSTASRSYWISHFRTPTSTRYHEVIRSLMDWDV